MREPLPPEVRSTIHNLLAEIARYRPLTRAELRLRCMSAPRPWRDEGCSPSTYYRRKKRARLTAEAIKANPQKSDRAIAAEIGTSKATVQRAREQVVHREPPEERVGRDGKFYPATQRQAVAA